jgi:hypothetical protein
MTPTRRDTGHAFIILIRFGGITSGSVQGMGRALGRPITGCHRALR